MMLILPSPFHVLQHPSIPDGRLYIKRDDLIHPEVGGNKWRKLYTAGQMAGKGQIDQLITMGGSHSNHIAAVAAAGRLWDLKTQAYIRDTDERQSPTLVKAREDGMEMEYISRSKYRALRRRFSEARLDGRDLHLPEGGAGRYAEEGLKQLAVEIESENSESSSVLLLVAAGTGTTAFNLRSFLSDKFTVQVHPAGKGFKLGKTLSVLPTQKKRRLQLISDERLRSFGSGGPSILDFMDDFAEKQDVLLDPLYTAPMVQRFLRDEDNLHNRDYDRIIIYHSGGLQGIKAYRAKYNSE